MAYAAPADPFRMMTEQTGANILYFAAGMGGKITARIRGATKSLEIWAPNESLAQQISQWVKGHEEDVADEYLRREEVHKRACAQPDKVLMSEAGSARVTMATFELQGGRFRLEGDALMCGPPKLLEDNLCRVAILSCRDAIIAELSARVTTRLPDFEQEGCTTYVRPFGIGSVRCVRCGAPECEHS